MMKRVALPLAIAILLFPVAAGCSSKTSTNDKTAKSKEAKARFVVITRKSSCWEAPSVARAFAEIYVSNRGTASGSVDVYNWFRYSDSGLALAGPDTFTVSAQRTNVFRITHDYNALKHDVIECHAMIGIDGPETPIKVLPPQ